MLHHRGIERATFQPGAESPKIPAMLAKGVADYRRLANALPQIIWTCDAEGQLEWVNDRWTELTGMSLEESLRDKAALDVVHPDDRAQVMGRFAEAVATSTPCEIEYRIRNRAGVYRFHVCRCVPVRDDQGVITSWVAAAFDMHDRRQAEEALRASERRFETVFELYPQPTAVTRLVDGTYLSVNAAFSKMTGYAREDVLGKSAVDLGVWTAEQQAAIVIGLQGQGELDVPYRTKDGHSLTLALVSARIEIDGEPCLVNVASDVTARRAAETAMREADRRKDEFLALLSHELRNPLAPILTAAQLMQMRGDVATPREREVIVRQVKHLVRLVDDLLDVSRVARGKVTLSKRPLELGVVVAKAVEATAPLLEQRRHELRLSVAAEGLLVDADEVRLTQVISNLLTNAARYTDPGGRIAVAATREGAEIVLRVRDNGVGIAPALLPHIFEMFVQGSRGPDHEGGLGLGLSLVQTLTALHGGRATAHSDGPGRGSEFTVRLPAAPPAADGAVGPAGRVARRAAEARGQRILVVDDNRDGAEMLSILLADAGYEVQLAGDASQALTISYAFRPHVAILDIGLPVMDGYSLGRELRAHMADAPPILIALTGYGQEQDRRRSAEAGFSLHLVKPVDPEKLRHLVDALLGSA
jgi:PAS domain S-box-containing protein